MHDTCQHDKINGEPNHDGGWLLAWCERCGVDLPGEPIVTAPNRVRAPLSCVELATE